MSGFNTILFSQIQASLSCRYFIGVSITINLRRSIVHQLQIYGTGPTLGTMWDVQVGGPCLGCRPNSIVRALPKLSLYIVQLMHCTHSKEPTHDSIYSNMLSLLMLSLDNIQGDQTYQIMQSAQVASRSGNILIQFKLYLIKSSLSSESGDINRLGYVVGDTQPLHSLDSSGRIQLGSSSHHHITCNDGAT